MYGMTEAAKAITLQHLKILAREFDCYVHTRGDRVVMSRQDGSEFLDYLTLHCESPTQARDVAQNIISAFA